MIRTFFVIISALTLFFFSFPLARAQEVSRYTKGTVTTIINEQEIRTGTYPTYVQRVRIERSDTQEMVEIEVGTAYQPIEASKRLRVGQTVIVAQTAGTTSAQWVLIDHAYRLPILALLLAGFLGLVLAIARLQGLLSILGMTISFIILHLFIIPRILSGTNPILVSMGSSVVIGAISMYLSHGINRKSHIAYGSIIVTLTLTGLLTAIVLTVAAMSGAGSEEALFLLLDTSVKVNLRGLLLAGIVLGTLGVLDDICIAQVSLVQELVQAKPHISWSELLSRGLAVGKDHIASLVNTLVLAYAGASLPLFLLFSLYNTQPWWVVLNSEMIAEEVVRSLIGSIGLVLAVPIATIVAAIVFLNRPGQDRHLSRVHAE